jgi:DNA-binding GntR family transcriptional regulator
VKNKFYSKFRKALRNINSAIVQGDAGKYKELSMNFVYKLVALIDNKYKTDHNMSPELLSAA